MLPEKFLKAVFPPMCAACDVFLDAEEVLLCPSCQSRVIWIDTDFFGKHLSKQYFDTAKSLAMFDSVWQNVIHRFKYNRMSCLASKFASLLSKKIDFEYDLIAFVPMHKRKIMERGYNQSALLAKKLVKETGLNIRYDLLKRTVDNKPQIGFSARERVLNVKGIFDVGSKLDIKGKDILLIDDVITTGATVNECAQVLKKNSAGRVDVLTLARA